MEIQSILKMLARAAGTGHSNYRRAAHPSGCATCGAGAGCSSIECHLYIQTTMHTYINTVPLFIKTNNSVPLNAESQTTTRRRQSRSRSCASGSTASSTAWSTAARIPPLTTRKAIRVYKQPPGSTNNSHQGLQMGLQTAGIRVLNRMVHRRAYRPTSPHICT